MNWRELALGLKKRVAGTVTACASMKEHTAWQVGGPADLLCIPQTEADVLQALKFAAEYGLAITVIGNGSNLLVRNGGIRGLTIKIAGVLNTTQVQESSIRAGAGVLLPALARVALRASLGGLEFAAGIPGSLGGGVVMNVGAFGQRLGDLIEEVKTVDFQGTIKVWQGSQLSFDYRSSSLLGKDLIVLGAVLGLEFVESSVIAERMKRNLAARRETQPLDLPTAGSVFKNPPGYYAGELIEKAGLKGFSVGDAQISPKHANFIVNRGNAGAGQVLALITTVQERVRVLFGIDLVPEVRLVGEEEV